MSDSVVAQRSDRAVFGVLFAMLFAFSYSEQLVSGVYPIVGDQGQNSWRIGVFVVDAVVLGVVGVLKRRVTRDDGDTSRLWVWWWAGVILLLGVDLVRLVSHESIRIDVLTATVYACALGMTTAASLNADPLTLFSTARRVHLPVDWVRVRAIVPLVLGTWVCYLAATAFIDYFEARAVRVLDPAVAAEIEDLPLTEHMAVLSQLCESAISPVFFQQVVGVMPVLLLTLGIEFNFFRRTMTDATQRAATAATATVMAAGLILALSTLPWDGTGCDDVLSSWHEYLAFLLAVQGIFTGLATLVWMLVASNADTLTEVRGEPGVGRKN
jgi:hypothetical protein